MPVKIEIIDRRAYAIGDTFKIKDCLKNIGAHWDADRRAWWISSTKQVELQRCIDASATAQSQQSQSPQTVMDEQTILGKAKYKGKSGYLILWMGTTSRGEAAKLAFRDGSKMFWADQSEIQIEKTYRDREWRGRTEPGMTFGRLKKLAADYAQAKQDGIAPCGKCGGIHRPEDKGCYMCGCTKCDGAHGGLCEDD